MANTSIIKSVFEAGYWWVEIPNELWYNATFMDWHDGIPIYTRRP